MQASNLSGSEKAMGAAVALLSAYGAYQGADASHQAELNRAKMDSLRIELEEHHAVRDQMSKMLVVDLRDQAKLAQAAAQYELAGLTLDRLPRKDRSSFAAVLERSIASSLADLEIQRKNLDLELPTLKDKVQTVAAIRRISLAIAQITQVRQALLSKAAIKEVELALDDEVNLMRLDLFHCEQENVDIEESLRQAAQKLQAVQRKTVPKSLMRWRVRRGSALTSSDQKAWVKHGNEIVVDEEEHGFAETLMVALNDPQSGLVGRGSKPPLNPWKITTQTSHSSPWYVSLRYCPDYSKAVWHGTKAHGSKS